MFTGIVEEVGTVISVGDSFIKAAAKDILCDVHIGDSIAVNGCCLTVTEFTSNTVTLDVMNETFNRTNLGLLKSGNEINLERAMAANGRFGGHIVSGHIDGTGIIKSFRNDGIATWITVGTVPEILKYIVMKGSVAIDGVSLTVADLNGSSFKVSLIPHTKCATALLTKKVGDVVNLENDIIGKYVDRFLNADKQSKIDMDFLAKCGF